MREMADNEISVFLLIVQAGKSQKPAIKNKNKTKKTSSQKVMYFVFILSRKIIGRGG